MDDSPSLMGLPTHLIGPSGTPALLPETCPLASSPWVIYKTWNEKNTAIIAAAIIAVLFSFCYSVYILIIIYKLHTYIYSILTIHPHTLIHLYTHIPCWSLVYYY